MSVQTQIDRISSAVSSALSAVAEKGVTVPSGTKVDGLAELIAAIEAGGGGGVAGFSNVASGTFTVAETPTSDFTIETGEYVLTSNHVIVLPSANANNSQYNYLYSACNSTVGGTQRYHIRYANSSNYFGSSTSGSLLSHQAKKLTINSGASKYLVPGVSYTWIILKL